MICLFGRSLVFWEPLCYHQEKIIDGRNLNPRLILLMESVGCHVPQGRVEGVTSAGL